MATYYVRLDGNNSNSGTGYTNADAWATLAKAVSTVSAGDIVYIAPGTYRESLTIATSGSIGSFIYWVGDNNSRYFLDINPGVIRITTCDINELPTANSVINLNSKTYNDFSNFTIDGVNTTATVGAVVGGGVNTIFRYCNIFGSYYGLDGNTNSIAYNCLFAAGYASVSKCTCYNCITIGGRNGYYLCDTINCIANGGGWGFNNSNCTNCSSIGASIGFGVYGNYAIKNCVAKFCETGFIANVDSSLNRCKAINCSLGFKGSSTNSKPFVSNCKYSQCVNAQDAANTTGTVILSEYEGILDSSRLQKLATALKDDLRELTNWSTDLNSMSASGASYTYRYSNDDYTIIGTYNSQSLYQNMTGSALIFYSNSLVPNNWIIQLNATTTPNEAATVYGKLSTISPIGTYTAVGAWGTTVTISSLLSFTDDYDILHHPRRMLNGSLNCGAFAKSIINLDYIEQKTFAPCIKITMAGFKRIVIPVKAGVSKTISVWTKWTSDGGALNPQLIISSQENILSSNPIVVTAAGDGSTYEQLSSTFTPIASGLLQIEFYARNTQSGAYAYFSDMQL